MVLPYSNVKYLHSSPDGSWTPRAFCYTNYGTNEAYTTFIKIRGGY
jgi:hypothetical protein